MAETDEECVILFGSRARGEQSDLHVLVIHRDAGDEDAARETVVNARWQLTPTQFVICLQRSVRSAYVPLFPMNYGYTILAARPAPVLH